MSAKVFFCCGHHLKRKEARVSLFFSSWNNWKHWNSVFGIWFLIAGWCNERKIMLIFLFAYLTYLIYAIYSWTYVMFKKNQNGFVRQKIILCIPLLNFHAFSIEYIHLWSENFMLIYIFPLTVLDDMLAKISAHVNLTISFKLGLALMLCNPEP